MNDWRWPVLAGFHTLLTDRILIRRDAIDLGLSAWKGPGKEAAG